MCRKHRKPAFKAQGAAQSCFCTTYRPLKGQGATEYLVLLAVVLIIALVSIALLGFFPGTASDSQMKESEIYWKSASPIAITESAARVNTADGEGYTYPYLRLRNTGPYPVRITKFLSSAGVADSVFCGPPYCGTLGYYPIQNMTSAYIAPGGETSFSSWVTGDTGFRVVWFVPSGGGGSTLLIQQSCKGLTAPPGMVTANGFGFEYIAYIDGQQITKRQVGKPLVIKCDTPT